MDGKKKEQLSFSKTVVCAYDGYWSRLEVTNATEFRHFLGSRVLLRKGTVLQRLALSSIPLKSAPEKLCYYNLFRHSIEQQQPPQMDDFGVYTPISGNLQFGGIMFGCLVDHLTIGFFKQRSKNTFYDRRKFRSQTSDNMDR